MRWIISSLCVCVLSCTQAHAYVSDQQPMFGTYSQKYLDKRQAIRWKQLCRGGGRYQAMSEAYQAGKPDPCNSPKERSIDGRIQ